ncbi:MAG: Fic family protein [Akkermansiaceae bacterium]
MSPPYTITGKILNLISSIERLIGRVESVDYPKLKSQPQLRKSSRVKTLQGSLAIEGNSLDLEQVTAILDGKPVIAPKNDIEEVLNANAVYENLLSYKPTKQSDLLKSHKLMMKGLIAEAGRWRSGNVGIMKGDVISHMAPPSENVPYLMNDLFKFLKSDTHPLIKGAVFHYEFEFIHPFQDGNGRMGRFWHTLMLYHYHEIFEYIPVESLIKKHQEQYYKVLEQCDSAGESTQFVEFSLEMVMKSLEDFIDVFRPRTNTPSDRLENAHKHFGNKSFSRKDYLELYKTISTATASRDLKVGVDKSMLGKSGDRALTIYRFEVN